MRRLLAALLLICPALACGKYGPPLRAGEVRPAKPAPRFEVPLPPAGEAPAPEPEPEAAVEKEPPPEGAP